MSFLKNASRLLLVAIAAIQLAACSQTVQWDEEVQLNDGRVIVVTQKKRCEGGDVTATRGATCIAREAWLTMKLSEFSDKNIVWHESLDPFVVNVHQGHLYIVGRPPHTLEFRAYGATNPPYFGFVWEGTSWRRIPFSEIPIAIYDSNMLIESITQNKTGFLSLATKNGTRENGNPVYPNYLRRVDPKHITSAF